MYCNGVSNPICNHSSFLIDQPSRQATALYFQVEVFQSEKALLEAFTEATQALDPDIILGFEVQKGSLGYLADRAATMDLPLLKLVSRTPEVCCLPPLTQLLKL